ncbi:MAG: accessory gene regulator B family protein [Bacilli bacterium]
MYENISKYVISFFSKHQVINEDPLIYQYGFMITLSYFISSIAILVIGLLLNSLISAFIYIFLFDKLREYAGGYHARSYLECSLLFITLFIVCVVASNIIPYLCLFIISSSLLLLSTNYIPTYHPNKKANDSLTYRTSKIAFNRFVIVMLSSILLYFINPSISSQMNIVIIEILILIRIQFYLNQKKEVNQ